MKKQYFISAALLVLVILFSGCSKNSNSDALNWHDRLEPAVQIAQKEHKPILVDFTGSDWCVWCKRLNNEVFSKDEFVKYANNNLVLVKIDFPEKLPQSNETKYYNQQIAKKYNIKGFPTIVLLNSSGNVVAFTGYREGGASAYVQYLKSLLKS